MCRLCAREFPLFFHGNEQQVNTVPERAMPKLLIEMKRGLLSKANYLKYLKISNKWVSPCNCVVKEKKKPIMVHAYC